MAAGAVPDFLPARRRPCMDRVSHWLLYATGVTASYSCMFHGLLQMQTFMMTFAIGFLLTALPRRTQTPPAASAEMMILAAALIVIAIAAITEHWAVAEIAYVGIF